MGVKMGWGCYIRLRWNEDERCEYWCDYIKVKIRKKICGGLVTQYLIERSEDNKKELMYVSGEDLFENEEDAKNEAEKRTRWINKKFKDGGVEGIKIGEYFMG